MREQLTHRVEQGKPTPHVERRPELLGFLRHVLEEFFALGAARPVGFGLGPIPPAAIEGHLDMLELAGEDRHDYRRWWRALDRRFLEFHRKRQKDKPKTPKTRPRPEGRRRHRPSFGEDAEV